MPLQTWFSPSDHQISKFIPGPNPSTFKSSLIHSSVLSFINSYLVQTTSIFCMDLLINCQLTFLPLLSSFIPQHRYTGVHTNPLFCPQWPQQSVEDVSQAVPISAHSPGGSRHSWVKGLYCSLEVPSRFHLPFHLLLLFSSYSALATRALSLLLLQRSEHTPVSELPRNFHWISSYLSPSLHYYLVSCCIFLFVI